MERLRLEHISKSFPGVKALDDITLEVKQGEVHAVCGENGAGKSTLMNILSGNLKPDSGTLQLNGKFIQLKNPQDAFAHGISIVHQHLSLADNLSVAENIFANQHPKTSFGLIHYADLYQQTAQVLADLKISIPPTVRVASLSQAQKQMVEIAKALAKKPHVLILDEPTAALTDTEIKVLFNILDDLKRNQVSILYISHRLSEIFKLADRVSILKDGKHQGTFTTENLTKEQLIKYMVGRDLIEVKQNSIKQSTILLEVKNLSGKKFKNISFALHRGEIIGLAGLVGAGRTEIARVLFGADAKLSGEIIKEKNQLHITHPADAIANKIAYVSEDRKQLGLFPEMSIQENMIAASLRSVTRYSLISSAKSSQHAKELSEKLNVVARSLQQKVGQLSGGNQQKVLLGKWLAVKPDVLIVDEPTNGVDVGAKQEIYRILKTLADEGMGIIVISSELPELLSLCQRILVIRKGMLVGELPVADATEENILSLAAH